MCTIDPEQEPYSGVVNSGRIVMIDLIATNAVYGAADDIGVIRIV